MAAIFFILRCCARMFLCCTGILKLDGLRFLYSSLFDLQKILAQHFAVTKLMSRNSWAKRSSQKHRWPRPSALSECTTVHNTAPLCLISFVFACQPCLSSVALVFSMCLLLRVPLVCGSFSRFCTCARAPHLREAFVPVFYSDPGHFLMMSCLCHNGSYVS